MRTGCILLALLGAILSGAATRQVPSNVQTGSTIKLRSIASSAVLGGKPAVEIEVSSERPFPAINALVELQIGSRVFPLSRYKDGRLNTLIFTLTLDEFAQTTNGDRVVVHYEPDSQGHWDFGPLDKTQLSK